MYFACAKWLWSAIPKAIKRSDSNERNIRQGCSDVPGKVEKIIKSPYPNQPEKAQVSWKVPTISTEIQSKIRYMMKMA